MIQDIGTVFSGELSRRIKSRPFLIGLFVGVFAIAAMVKLPALMNGATSSARTVVLVGNPALTARAKPLFTDPLKVAAEVPPQAVDMALLKKYDAGGAIAITSDAKGLSAVVYAKDPTNFPKDDIQETLLPLQLQLTMHRSAKEVDALSNATVAIKTIGSKFTSSDQVNAAQGFAMTLIVILYLLILINVQLITASVAEEKTSRIAELLVASINTSALLIGKILAGAVLSLIQLVVWIGASMLFGSSPGDASSSHSASFGLGGILNVITPGLAIAFFGYFIIGFLQLSTLLGAFASLINRTEDLGAVTAPLVLPAVAGMMIAMTAVADPDTKLAIVTSILPVLAPFVMFARIVVSNVPMWQVALSLAINLGSLYLIAYYAGKIYRVGMLLYGRPPKFSQILTVLKT